MPAVAGRYKALRKIADGGTAEVFLAEQVGAAGFRRLVVLKRIRPELYADEMFRRILVEEAHVTMGLHHSNLVEVLDLGESRGRYFLVLELVDGWTLQQLLERARAAKVAVTPELAAYLVTEVCRALGYAHERTRAGVKLNIVHRDVCPNNVLVSDTGEVKLADFGIAKARIRSSNSAIGTVAGKPSWMSPEQASAEPVDARSDLFSAGTLLYYLLTGEPPFRAPNERELLVRVASGEFVSPAKVKASLPKELVKVVLEAMKRDPKLRFQSAQEMVAALEKVQRSVLPPFGRTELEAWMRALNKKDGQVPVTRESMLPVPKKADEPEWIELSSDELKTSPPEKVEPEKPARGTSRMFAVLALVAAIAMAAWWFLTSPLPRRGEGQGEGRAPEVLVQPPSPAPAPAPVAEQPPAVQAAPAPVAEEEAVADSGAEETPDAEVLVAPTDPLTPPLSPTGEREAPVAPPVALAPLKVWGRLSPDDNRGDRLGVMLDTDPPGAKVRLDSRELGTTPVALRFKAGIPFELTFEREGHAPRVLWLQLVERADKSLRVTLSPPPQKR